MYKLNIFVTENICNGKVLGKFAFQHRNGMCVGIGNEVGKATSQKV
jgi:hypothetical protein